jgi:hypothetical protein
MGDKVRKGHWDEYVRGGREILLLGQTMRLKVGSRIVVEPEQSQVRWRERFDQTEEFSLLFTRRR